MFRVRIGFTVVDAEQRVSTVEGFLQAPGDDSWNGLGFVINPLTPGDVRLPPYRAEEEAAWTRLAANQVPRNYRWNVPLSGC